MTESPTRWLDQHVGIIDVLHRDREKLIACYVVRSDDGLILVESGPGITSDNLVAGIESLGLDPASLRHILLTHIHHDHAGASGTLMKQFPDTQLYVHERGARHMIDPSRLVASAERIYGAIMDSLWGEFLACPEERVTVVGDGDHLTLGGQRINVLYTPGHASHHVSYHLPDIAVVFAGDVAGVRIPPSDLVWPPTPPPDIDVPAWHNSIANLRALSPERIMITHFGMVDSPPAHLDQLDSRLDEWTTLVEKARDAGKDRDAIAEDLEKAVMTSINSEQIGGDSGESTGYVTPFGMSVDGLLRYLDKRDSSD